MAAYGVGDMREPIKSFEAFIHILSRKARARCRSVPHKRFFLG